MAECILEGVNQVASVVRKILQVLGEGFPKIVVSIIYPGNYILHRLHVNPHHKVILVVKMVVECGLGYSAVRGDVLYRYLVYALGLG